MNASFVALIASATLLLACNDAEEDPASAGAQSAASAGPGSTTASSGSSGGGTSSSSGAGAGGGGAEGGAGGAGAAGGAGGGGDGGAGGGGGAGGAAQPTAYTLQGAASGVAMDGSESVECTLTLYFSNAVYDAAGGFTADMGGEVLRIVTAGPNKYEFQALVGVDAQLVPTMRGVDVVLNDMPDPSAKPFWQALDVLHGQSSGTHEYEGTWLCAPLMIDEPGWKDTKTTVMGTWTLLPTP